jgi:hypothetical protein
MRGGSPLGRLPISSDLPLEDWGRRRLTLSIWMKDMLRYRYTTFERIKLILKQIPIGRMPFTYNMKSISALFSTSEVVRERTWVAIVANNMCHVVRVMENGKRSRIHLLKTITMELRTIHALLPSVEVCPWGGSRVESLTKCREDFPSAFYSQMESPSRN